jgi:murein DD-endopeptidase MepM/ murein hydrolase activator NlpD
VISAGWSGGYGNLVVVDHGNGLSTAYGHMSSIAVSSGQSVAQGTVLGGMGTTGNSTGVHLHFEVRVNGSAVNPLGYL